MITGSRQRWSPERASASQNESIVQKISGTENVNTPFRRILEMMTSLFFGCKTTPNGFLSVVLGRSGSFISEETKIEHSNLQVCRGALLEEIKFRPVLPKDQLRRTH